MNSLNALKIALCVFACFALASCSFWHGDRGTVVFQSRTPASTDALRAKSAEIREKLSHDSRLHQEQASEGWAFSAVKGGEFEHFGILWISDNGLNEAEIVIQCSYDDLKSERLHVLVELVRTLIGAELLRELETTRNSSPFA